MRPSPHHPQHRPPQPLAVLRVYPEQHQLGSVRIPQCQGEPAGVVIPPGSRWSPRNRWLRRHPCSRERTLPWHPPSCSGASLEAAPAGLARTLCGHGERPRGPQNTRGDTATPTATGPALRWPCGQGWLCATPGMSPSQSHPAPSTPRGKECLAQHPAVPAPGSDGAPRAPWHRMGVFKHDLAGTSVFTHVSLRGHGCECTPKQTHLYEYCIAYIIFFFFTQMTVLTRCQENNIGSQRFYQLL